MIIPITPKECCKIIDIPENVIKAFNKLIQKNWNGRSYAVVKQHDVVNLILSNYASEGLKIKRQEIFDKGYLDVETLYWNYGWEVKYEKQCIGDNFDSYYTFAKRPDKE